jgi:hypothetical protein
MHVATRAGLTLAGLALYVTLSLSKGESQPLPSAPSPSPSPSPSATPNPIGPSLGNNDPCTSMSAIVTRPSVTNSVCTVRPNHVEVETGYINSTSSTGGGNTVTYQNALIRVGTTIPALELQIAPPSLIRTNAGGANVATSDIGAGLKYVFGYTPKFSFGGQVNVTAPTGLGGGSSNGTTSTYALNMAYTLSPAFALGSTLATSSQTNGVQRWPSFAPTLVVNVSLPNSTGLFAEIATFSNAIGPASATRTQYMFGVTRDIGPRLQLDASTAISPTTATGRYHTIGFGASYYF